MADSAPLLLALEPRFRALATLSARLNTLDMTRLLVNLVDTTPVEVLPWLAEQFHVLDEGWHTAADDAARRALIKSSIELHRHKGTPWAVRQALARIGLERIKLVENWQASPKRPAYTFRVLFPPVPALEDAAKVAEIRRTIDQYKNVRSHYDMAISLNPTDPCEPVDAPARIPCRTGIRYLGIWHVRCHSPQIPAQLRPHVGLAGVGIARLHVPDIPLHISLTVGKSIGGNLVARLGPGWPVHGWRDWCQSRSPTWSLHPGWHAAAVVVLRPWFASFQMDVQTGAAVTLCPVLRPWPASAYAWRGWQRPNDTQMQISDFALGLAQGYSQSGVISWTVPGEGDSASVLNAIESSYGE